MTPEFIHRSETGVVVRFQVDLYPIEAVQAAAHKFTDRCYVHVERGTDDEFVVRLKANRPLDNAEHLAGQFANEVLDQVLRLRLRDQTQGFRNLILAQAFSRTNLVEPELDVASPMTDPAGFAYPDAETGRTHT